jgi:hypothetical protein
VTSKLGALMSDQECNTILSVSIPKYKASSAGEYKYAALSWAAYTKCYASYEPDRVA